jgi:hypothetical protein
VTPWPTKNHDNPNVTEIVFENDLDELLNQGSAEQLKESPNFFAVLEMFRKTVKVTPITNALGQGSQSHGPRAACGMWQLCIFAARDYLKKQIKL